MRLKELQRAVLMLTLLLAPAITVAQEADVSVSGVVVDSTGALLPGVTVAVVHEATGNVFTTVTDGGGGFRVAVRLGLHRLTAELSGFATINRTVNLLAGQQAVVRLEMAPSTVQESVTVTGEAPLLDVSGSTLGGNIDPTQMQELPVNGRNWQDLAILAPGMRANEVRDQPVVGTNAYYQINLDGQQITNDIGADGFGGPRFSRDAIAEFEFLSSRFDATQGRSSGVLVNAITKSGTTTLQGSASGYFRDDKFNAADFIERRVLPYSDQQLSLTAGGPLRRDRIHFFANYEYEREPQTFTYNTPYAHFNQALSGIRNEHKAGARLDFQLSTAIRAKVRASKYTQHQPFDPAYTGGATLAFSAQESDRTSDQLLATFNQVLSSRTLNEVNVGYTSYGWTNLPLANKWGAGHPHSGFTQGLGTPRILLNGLSIGQGHSNSPQWVGLNNYSLRDDFMTSFTKGGRHDIKFGGEYLYIFHFVNSCRSCMGIIDARGGPIPANIESLFPVWDDPNTWNLAALSPITRRYTLSVGSFPVYAGRHVYAGWLQDDWAIGPRLTLNLGLRYDLSTGLFAQEVEILPFLESGRPEDTNNLGPRVGFAYTLSDATVLRGGIGKYFGDTQSQTAHWSVAWSQIASVEVLNDGRPDFAANPFNGADMPTFESAVAGARRAVTQLAAPDLQVPWSWQGSMGVQRQIGRSAALEADYVFVANRHELYTRNINLAFNPATGMNYPFNDVRTLPYPDWGAVEMFRGDGKTNSHSLQTAFTKRMSDGWQASATYTLAGDWRFDPLPLNPGCQHPIQPSRACDLPFSVAPDLGEGTMYWAGNQKHRLVFNGIWQVGFGLQVSGLYFFGSGAHLTPTAGVDVRRTGANNSRLRADGSVIPRNSFKSQPIHRVDMRVQRRFGLPGRATLDGIAEVFNAFNHENYGSYVTVESNANFGQPQFDNNVAYAPRMLQFGFRLAF